MGTDLESKQKTTSLKQSKRVNEVLAAKENEHQIGIANSKKNDGILITNISPNMEERRRNRNKSSERVKSQDVSEINERLKENKVFRLDVEKGEISTNAIKHGKENVISKECEDLTDKHR